MSLISDMVKAQHTDMYEMLVGMSAKVEGIDPANTSFGVRVKTTEHGWVMLKRTIYNWRLMDCRNDPFTGFPTEASGVARAWCYAEPYSALHSVLAALAWSGNPDTEPSGWIKSLPDERRHGEPRDGITQE